MKDLYENLGITRDATQEEIKARYRYLARKHHPDKGGDEIAFKKMKSAYDILGNHEKRKRYDRGEPEIKDPMLQARQEFAYLFNMVISDPNYDNQNLINIMITSVNNNIAMLKNEKNKILQNRHKSLRLKRELKFTGEFDIASEVLRSNRLTGVRRYSELKKGFIMLNLLLKIIKEYRYIGNVNPVYRSTTLAHFSE